MSLAENLQFLRKQNKITQEDLADYLGVSRQSVSKWETGEAYPETEKLIAIADKFNVSMDDLARGDITAASVEETPLASEVGGASDISADATSEPQTSDVIVDATVSSDTPSEERLRHCNRDRKTKTAIGGIVMATAALIYLIIGCVWGLWHPGWIVFLIGGIFDRLIEFTLAIAARKKPDARALSDMVGSVLFMAAVIIFIVLGVTKELWHPAWIAFPAAIVGSAIADIIIKSVKS